MILFHDNDKQFSTADDLVDKHRVGHVFQLEKITSVFTVSYFYTNFFLFKKIFSKHNTWYLINFGM